MSGVTAHITGTAHLWHPSDLPPAVSFLSLWRGEPVYHDPDGSYGREIEHEDGSYVWRMRSRCGRVLYEEEVHGDGSYGATREFEQRIPSRHAVRFGKPCLRCWPEVREVLQEVDADD